jgi:hypothetical protein
MEVNGRCEGQKVKVKQQQHKLRRYEQNIQQKYYKQKQTANADCVKKRQNLGSTTIYHMQGNMGKIRQ